MRVNKNRQILMVEAEKVIALDRQGPLECLGYSVLAVAGSGRQALHLARQRPFDPALMEIRLKDGIDGIQTARALQPERDVPVVCLTAPGDTKVTRRAKASRAFRDIVKPIDKPLRSVIENTIHPHRMARSASRKLEPAGEQPETLAARLNLAEEFECRRIAHLLLDDVRPHLAAIALEMETQQNERDQPPQLRVTMRSASRTLRQLCRGLDRLSHELHPRVMEEKGLPAGLRRLCREYVVLGLNVRFQRRAAPPVIQAQPAILLYRMAQEILQNVLKHAGTNKTMVSLEGTSACIILRVSNQGAGFDPEILREKSQLGRRSMADRVARAGGVLRVTSKQGGGTEISAAIPCLDNRA